MNPNEVIFSEERKHLLTIHERIDDALKAAEESVQKLDREYRDMKRYMAEYRGEIDPHEMFQTERLLTQTDRTGAFAVDTRDRIVKLKDSPYFARVDFQENDDEEPESYYIGRFSFNHRNELLIFDWRAPISSLFYDCEVGPAGFDAPVGRIDGRMTRKRQFKIKNGIMEYALESSANVQDDVLSRELSHTSDEKMKSIISTIQKEQNQIIRNEKAETMIIQGVAGSGKTSIALHRIAFLLYRFKGKLSARNVTILSPNKVFGDYIANVIPELGEEPIYELSFADLAELQLDHVIGFEPDRDPLEVQDEAWRERVRFKSTMAFMARLDEYIRGLDHRIFVPVTISSGPFTAEAEWIAARFAAYGKYPIRRRLEMTADDIRKRFMSEHCMEDELPRLSALLKSLTAMLTMKNTLTLYQDFYRREGVPDLFVMPAKNTLEWADVFPFLYLHAAFEGMKQSGLTRHLVIDEMQDYTPIQYAALNRMFPCPKTILGDFGQFINPNHLHTLEDMKALYPQAEFVMLNKSYRSSYEIIMFAKRIQSAAQLEPVKRHGEEPVVAACGSGDEMMRRIRDEIGGFKTRASASLGIILKTNRDAKAMHHALTEYLGTGEKLHLLTPESLEFKNGVSVTSIRMAKGLEFDEVIILGTDDQNYVTDYDRSLLYIACTRAMHRLTLLYTGRRSRLIV